MTKAERRGMEKALDRAIEAAKSRAQIARIAGITRQAVQQWAICPPEFVLAIERETQVSRHDLRPDIYPPGI